MNITIKEKLQLSDYDINKILEIANESEYISLNYDNIKYYIESECNKIFLSYCDDTIIGFLIFSHIENEIDIIDLAVDSFFRNKSIGSLIINYLISYASENKANRITLDVSEKNTPAYNFYLKHKFIIDAKRLKYYKNKYSAILMSLRIV